MNTSKITSAITASLLLAACQIVHAAPVGGGTDCPGNGFPNVPATVPEPAGNVALCIGIICMGAIIAFRKITAPKSPSA